MTLFDSAMRGMGIANPHTRQRIYNSACEACMCNKTDLKLEVMQKSVEYLMEMDDSTRSGKLRRDAMCKLPYFMAATSQLLGYYPFSQAFAKALLSGEQVSGYYATMKFAQNIEQAWYTVFDAMQLPITADFICTIHKILMQGFSVRAGELSTESNHAGLVPSQIIMGDMDEKLRQISQGVKELQHCFHVYNYITDMELFPEGNLAVAFIVTNFLLIKNGFGYIAFPELSDTNVLVDYTIAARRTHDYSQVYQFLEDNTIIELNGRM